MGMLCFVIGSIEMKQRALINPFVFAMNLGGNVDISSDHPLSFVALQTSRSDSTRE
jgi:hypothetical protein